MLNSIRFNIMTQIFIFNKYYTSYHSTYVGIICQQRRVFIVLYILPECNVRSLFSRVPMNEHSVYILMY